MRRIEIVAGLMLLSLVVTVMLLSATSIWNLYPNNDSSVFIYIGNGIREGLLPYQDMWDHKPPLIHYLNALATSISDGAFWGVWVMMWVFLYVTIVFNFALIKLNFGVLAAWLTTLFFITQFEHLIEDGNFVEQYALVFQFGALLCFKPLSEMTSRRAVLIGVLGAACFLLRQNLVSIWFAIGFYWLFEAIFTRHIRQFVHVTIWTVLSGITPLLLVGGYFFTQGAFTEMWHASFVYNIGYSNLYTLPLSSIVGLLSYGFRDVGATILGVNLFMLLPVCWLVSVGYVARVRPVARSQQALIVVGLLAMVFEVLWVNISTSGFAHYYLSWLAPASIIIATSIIAFQHGVAFLQALEARSVSIAVVTSVLIAFVILLDIVTYVERDARYEARLSASEITQTIDFIQSHAEADDTVMVWGNNVAVLNAIPQAGFTRYIYPYPLTKLDYDVARPAQEMLIALETNQPAIIVDTHNPTLPPLHLENPAEWQPRPGYGWNDDLGAVLSYIQANYQLFYVTEGKGWYVYRSYASMAP